MTLHCTVCERDYSSKSEWLIHLTSDNHQKLARQNCLEEWTKPAGLKMKKCCLVVYSSFPLTRVGGGAHRLIHHFSKGVRNWVTDFVYWEERPCLAILQFESGKKGRAIVSGLENNEVLIDNRQVKVKQAVDLWDLEWSAILPMTMSSTTDGDGIATRSATKRPLQPSQQEEYPNSIEPKRARRDKDPVLGPSPDLGLMTDDTLQNQFWSAIKSVTIPETTQETILEVARCLTALFRDTDSSNKVVLFRNCHLKLVNPNWKYNSRLLFYVYSNKPYAEIPNSSFTFLPDSYIEQTFNSSLGKTDFHISNCGASFECTYKPKIVKFTLFMGKRFIVEVQLCRLLEYMCTFDPRCHSLLAMAFYWTKVNGVAFGDLDFDPKIGHLYLPEPYTMEWLMIHFLCYKGIIPTVRQIQERPHCELRERYYGVDVGFQADAEFAREWNSKRRALDPTIPDCKDKSNEIIAVGVLELFQEFLEFYGETLDGDKGWILNTRDGEVINIQQFLTEDPGTLWSTKMNSIDLTGLRVLHQSKFSNDQVGIEKDENSIAVGYKKSKYRVKFQHLHLYMVHPFIFTWRFSLTKQLPRVLKLMKQSSLQLKMYLKVRESKSAEMAAERFGSLENVLTSNQADN